MSALLRCRGSRTILGCLEKGWNRQGVRVPWNCNTWPRRPHSKHVWNIPSHNLLQTNYCNRNSRNNAIVLRTLRAIASHELLHELLRQQTTIAATPLAESTPSPSFQNPCNLLQAHLPFQETTKDTEVEGSRSYQSSATPLFMVRKLLKLLLCWVSVQSERGGWSLTDLYFLNPRFPSLLSFFLVFRILYEELIAWADTTVLISTWIIDSLSFAA